METFYVCINYVLVVEYSSRSGDWDTSLISSPEN